MKTVGFFVNPNANEEILVRVQSRLISLLTIGNWGIMIPDTPCPATWQIVETCTRLKRKITTVGLHNRGGCSPNHYQSVAIPLCKSRKFLNHYQDYAEWERDNWIIAHADLVDCYDMYDISIRVPKVKGMYLLSAKYMIEPPGFGNVDFHLAQTMGLGRLWIERLKSA